MFLTLCAVLNMSDISNAYNLMNHDLSNFPVGVVVLEAHEVTLSSSNENLCQNFHFHSQPECQLQYSKSEVLLYCLILLLEWGKNEIKYGSDVPSYIQSLESLPPRCMQTMSLALTPSYLVLYITT